MTSGRSVRFHSDPTFGRPGVQRASVANAALVGPMGFAEVGAEQTDTGARPAHRHPRTVLTN
jgi:hypothetical protein